MEIFPTQYSLLSASALNEVIERRYGLIQSTCTLLIHNVSDTYLLKDNYDQYILKIYRASHRTLVEIKGEVELLNALKDAGTCVSFPLTDLEGGHVQSFQAAEGVRYGVLFTFAKGGVALKLDTGHLMTIGHEMAKIHNVTAAVTLSNPRIEYNTTTTLTYPLQITKPAFELLTEEYTYLAGIADKVAGKLRQLDKTKFSYGYCHYDFLPKNFHFDENGAITFFDFDFAGKGFLGNDVASFYIHLFLEVYYKKLTQEQADEMFKIFVDSYRSVRALSDDEIAAIPYLGFAFWIFYLGFHYENFEEWSNFFFTPRFIRERVALIKTWTEWYCKFDQY